MHSSGILEMVESEKDKPKTKVARWEVYGEVLDEMAGEVFIDLTPLYLRI